MQKPFVTVQAYKAIYNFTREECLEQLANWEQCSQVDNLTRWLFWRFIRDGKPKCMAKIMTQTILEFGSSVLIDVRRED